MTWPVIPRSLLRVINNTPANLVSRGEYSLKNKIPNKSRIYICYDTGSEERSAKVKYLPAKIRWVEYCELFVLSHHGLLARRSAISPLPSDRLGATIGMSGWAID